MPSTWIEERNTKKGLRRYVRWRNADGSKGCTPAGNYKDIAIAIRNQKQGDQYLGKVGLGNQKKGVEEIVAEYLTHISRTLRPKTVAVYAYSLKAFQESLQVD